MGETDLEQIFCAPQNWKIQPTAAAKRKTFDKMGDGKAVFDKRKRSPRANETTFSKFFWRKFKPYRSAIPESKYCLRRL